MDYDLSYFDLETRVVKSLNNPCGPGLSPCVAGTLCNLCVRTGPCRHSYAASQLSRGENPQYLAHQMATA
jgi:hypothetical protein